MKKILLTFFIILFCPLNILAYSKSVIPGGESIGIKIESDGLIVVGFYKVNDKYIASDNIKIGDNITHINNKRVYSISELSNVIEKSNTDEVDVKLLRKNKEVNTKLKLVKEDNLLKTGLYVKDNVVGLGTLTYIDPVTKIWGALGHEILLSETNSRIEVKNGNILMSKVTSINKSRNGKVGSKNANILFNKTKYSIPHILNISVMDVMPEVMVHALASHEIYVSSNTACSSGEVSNAVLAVYNDLNRAKHTIRISLSHVTTTEEINRFLEVFKEEYEKLSKLQ